MAGYYLICRKRTNGSKCSMAISADTKDELIAEALKHASSMHGMQETRGLKDEYRSWIKRGAPPA